MGSRADLLDSASVRHAYRRWAPVYDFTFGTVAESGRKNAVKIINRRRGRVLEGPEELAEELEDLEETDAEPRATDAAATEPRDDG